jgi:hypothetical protein
MKALSYIAVGLGAALAAQTAHATETGGGAYPNGAEALSIAALPPPGTYLLNYVNYYDATSLNDAHGKSQVPGFNVHAWGEIPRIVNVTKVKILGATWAQQLFVPVVDLTVHAAGQRGHRTGIGDIIVDPFILGWTKGNSHYVVGMDTWVPTGHYDKTDLANIGRHYWTFEPVFAFSHFDPKGGPELSMKLMYDFNTKNNATDYHSGQEFHTDFGLAYNFNPIAIGLNGYYYRQTTNDRQFGTKVGPDGYKGEAFALGPTVRYQAGRVPISFQWQREIFAYNRTQGDKFWIKAAFRF